MPELHIQLLGEFRLTSDDAPVNTVNAPRLQSLLAYLLLHRGAPQGRQHLAFGLWPDTTEAQARTNLRQLLHALKQTLPDADQFVHADAQTLQWRSDAPFRLDVAEFEQALTQAAAAEQTGDLHALRVALEQAIALYQGELLPSCYDDWMVLERERLRQAFTSALERLIVLFECQGEPRMAIAYGQRLVRHDPLCEETYRALMRLYAACGDRAGALRVYHTCATILDRELAVEPSVTTREAYEHLLKVDAQTRPVLPPQPANTNLPVPLTSFVGREVQITEVRRLLQTTRLLTLTGPGGCGKTRLALEAATNLLDTYPGGVWWVELAALSHAALVPQAVVTALGVREQSGRTLLETLVEYLRAKQVLVLLDNCEHLIEACAQLAEQWLSACPQLRILATSREALRSGGEITLLVPPLSLPEARPPATVEELMHSEAIQLFAERAATVLPTFRLTAANGPLVAQLCRRLDGIPLAIELAAARVKVLHVEQIAARLDDVFQLLTAGRRTALPRHQTLRAAMDWSHDLLSEKERVLFRRLAMFAGGWTLEAAETVCAGEGLKADDVLDVLSCLVDKSLVGTTQDGSAATRYRLLETIRQYAREKLFESGEAEQVRDRHLEFFLCFAEVAEPKLQGAEQLTWFNCLETEHDNVRTALDWAKADGSVQEGLRLASALRLFWQVRGYWSEEYKWLTDMLTLPGAWERTLPRAKALAMAAYSANWQGDSTIGQTLAMESITLCRELGVAGMDILAFALLTLGWTLIGQDAASARAAFEESLAIARQIGYQYMIAASLNALGVILKDQGDYTAAQALFEESVAIAQEAGDRRYSAVALAEMGFVLYKQGDYFAARSAFDRSLIHARAIGDDGHSANVLLSLGDIELNEGHYKQAQSFYVESLKLWQKIGDRYGIALSLECFAALAAAQENHSVASLRVANLLGAAEKLREPFTFRRESLLRCPYDRIVATVSARLGETTFETAWAQGRAMTLEEAVADALTVTAEQ